MPSWSGSSSRSSSRSCSKFSKEGKLRSRRHFIRRTECKESRALAEEGLSFRRLHSRVTSQLQNEAAVERAAGGSLTSSSPEQGPSLYTGCAPEAPQSGNTSLVQRRTPVEASAQQGHEDCVKRVFPSFLPKKNKTL